MQQVLAAAWGGAFAVGGPAHAGRRAPGGGSLAVRLAQRESDPEVAIMLWDDAVEMEASALALAGRGLCSLQLGEWVASERDLAAALEATPPVMDDARSAGALRALWLDSLGLARLCQGSRASQAKMDFVRALATAEAAGAGNADVPDAAPLSGLRGGAPTLAQRCAFHAALAAWEAEGPRSAAETLSRLDMGPAPGGTPPQFWEGRAALTAALYASGDAPAAEAEWNSLCRKTPPPPPATPDDPIAATVNRYAQVLEKLESATLSTDCEDFQTGSYLPCNDAGSVVGTGGSDSPCVVFTPSEVSARLWPAEAVASLAEFLGRDPRESAADRARATLQ